MSETGGMLGAYLICQALGWEWNFTSMILLTLVPLIIIGLILFVICIVIPFILEMFE